MYLLTNQGIFSLKNCSRIDVFTSKDNDIYSTYLVLDSYKQTVNKCEVEKEAVLFQQELKSRILKFLERDKFIIVSLDDLKKEIIENVYFKLR